MVHVHRSKGRILSCSDRCSPSALLEVCRPGPTLPVQGAPLRALPVPKGFYPLCCGSLGASADRGHEDPALSRRLVGVRAFPSPGGPGYQPSSVARVPAGPQGERCKKLPGSHSAGCLFGSGSGLGRHEGLSVREASGRHPPTPSFLQEGRATALHSVPAATRQTDGRIDGHTFRPVATAPASDVAEQLPSGPQTSQEQADQGVSGLHPRPGAMAGQGVPTGGCASGGPSLLPRDCYNRCIPARVGCSLAWQISPGTVVISGLCTAHQCAGAAGCPPGSPTFSTAPAGEACAGSIRQQGSGLPDQSSGGHQVGAAVAGVPAPSDMGRSPSVELASNVAPGGPESGSRFPLSAQASTWRVEAAPRGCRADLGRFRQSRGGSLCLEGVNPLSPMVFLDGGEQSTGTGCLGARVAQRAPVRLPTAASDPPDVAAGPSSGPPPPPGSPVLAREALVSTAAEALLRLAMASPREERSPVTARRSDLASRSLPSPVVGLAAAGPDSILTGCTESVRRTISHARASSTRLQYESKWRRFSAWCADRGEDPTSCPVATVLDFLQSLLDDGRAPSTLKVYVAAISSQHGLINNATVGCQRLVSLFLRGASRLRPSVSPRVPAWDLSLVLKALSSAPFEPLAQADLKWLSLKTAFLLAITSAKRVGELHALSVSESCLRWGPEGSGVTLWPNVAFLPKTLPRGHVNRPIHLARFDPPATDGELRALCPVRALVAYIGATAQVRQTEQLFVCYGGHNRGRALSKQRLSHWIVDTISQAYRVNGRALPTGVRCHSTRGVSTSWAALRGVPLDDICIAASWSSPGTFHRFYRLNVAAPHPLGVVLCPGSSTTHQ